MTKESFPSPRRIVQRFSLKKFVEFRRLSAADRLEWLEDIRSLYWAAVTRRSATER